jgi:hypothetical protein
MKNSADADGLVDIGEVSVDMGMPQRERIIEYVRQIKDPYHFRCGKFTVTVRFSKDGPSLDECLKRIAAQGCK